MMQYTCSYGAGCEFSGIPTLLTLAIESAQSGNRVRGRQKNTRHAEAGCCPSIACMNTNDKRAHSLDPPDTRHTVCIRREPWRSPHVTVPIPRARMTASAVSVRIWSVVEPIAACLGCCAPCVRARFRRARARPPTVGARRRRMTSSSYWIPGSEASMVPRNLHLFLRALKNKGLKEEIVTKIGLDD